MKSPRIMGREARKRNTPRRFNPFDGFDELDNFDKWLDGWLEEDLKIWLDSGLEMEDFSRKNRNLYKD